MQRRDLNYLDEMGFEYYQLNQPQKVSSHSPNYFSLSENCKLLFVSINVPNGSTLVMFDKVMKSMGLTTEMSLHVLPSDLSRVDLSRIEWIWFAGCSPNFDVGCKLLQTPVLEDIEGNNAQRRALWQQICSYQS